MLFGQPERSFFATEIIARLGAGSGAVQRELSKLADCGLLTVSMVGNQKHYQANPESPIYAELCTLIRKTVGLAEPLRQALEPALPEIELALVYGSVAKGSATASSDIDLLLVSDTLTLEEVFRRLAGANRRWVARSTRRSTPRTNFRGDEESQFVPGACAGRTGAAAQGGVTSW